MTTGLSWNWHFGCCVGAVDPNRPRYRNLVHSTWCPTQQEWRDKILSYGTMSS